MLETIKEETRQGGVLKISRFTSDGNECPSRYVRYLMGSLGYEKWRAAVNDITYWRLYYRESMAGHSADQIVDSIYFAEVDGEFAGRLWFGYSRQNGYGNFGNVFTEPEFRQRGIMSEMLRPCVADFMASPAKLLACATGNPVAAASYVKHGFEVIYGGACGPMALLKPELGRFTPYEQQQFSGHRIARVRAGVCGDQFACDKFLAYASGVWKRPHSLRVGPGSRISDYRIAFQETLSGNGVVTVAEDEGGVIVGYAFALTLDGMQVLDFRLHPNYMADGASLLRETLGLFEKHPIHCFTQAEDTERNKLLVVSGASLVASLEGGVNIYRMD